MKLSVWLGQQSVTGPRVKVADLKATQLKEARAEVKTRKPTAARIDLFRAISESLSLEEAYHLGRGVGGSIRLYIVQDDDPKKVRAIFTLTFAVE
ncbi:MAG: hypothetical protein PHV47_03095 [Candidatus Pacebacteria bacterium]|nr:hypothetical protein [Candidatus Paceibacterota bacterium]MDD5621534.1 hypothetical protein [Candidatus Paceibacterota bacterium]